MPNLNIRQTMVCTEEHTGFHPRLGDSQTIPVNLVMKYGNTNLEDDDDYDAEKTVIIEKNWVDDPTIEEQDWYWNSSTEEFQQTAP